MSEFSTYEFAVKQRATGAWLLARIALIVLYASVPLAVLPVCLLTRTLWPLYTVLPLGVWLLYFITWRYVAVEYEYSITAGVLTFSKIYNNRSRRRVLEIPLRDASRIAPLDNDTHSAFAAAWHPEKEYSAISSLAAPDIYYILFEHKDKKRGEKRRAIFYFEATERALKICRFLNPSATVLTETTR